MRSARFESAKNASTVYIYLLRTYILRTFFPIDRKENLVISNRYLNLYKIVVGLFYGKTHSKVDNFYNVIS